MCLSGWRKILSEELMLYKNLVTDCSQLHSLIGVIEQLCKFPADLITFTEKILNGNPHFLLNFNDWWLDRVILSGLVLYHIFCTVSSSEYIESFDALAVSFPDLVDL